MIIVPISTYIQGRQCVIIVLYKSMSYIFTFLNYLYYVNSFSELKISKYFYFLVVFNLVDEEIFVLVKIV